MAYIVRNSGAKALLIADVLAGAARELLAMRSDMPGLGRIVALGPIDDLPEWRERCAPISQARRSPTRRSAAA